MLGVDPVDMPVADVDAGAGAGVEHEVEVAFTTRSTFPGALLWT